ncbi:purine and uridine phosphorylase, partial [Penicillium argentinense]
CIFLGDIIVSSEIVVYDLGRRLPGGFRRKEGVTDPAANIEVQAFMHKLRSKRGRGTLLDRTNYHLKTLQKRTSDYRRPVRDRLFEPTYDHKHHSPTRCKKCKRNEHCKESHEATCETLGCDSRKLIRRFRPSPSQIGIHFGRIASGDTVMKSGVDRDRIAAEDNVIAFEMEGAGICNNLPCIVVKGVCDYADSHKDKVWQKHTAGAAAACMKSLLEQWAAIDHPDERHELHKMPVQAVESCSFDTMPQTPPSTNDDETHDLQKHHELDILQGKYCHSKIIGYNLILAVLSTTKSGFKNAIDCLKQFRKFLPRDTDLKRTLRNQRSVFSDHVRYLSSGTSVSVGEHLGSSREVCLQLAVAIQKKLEEIEIITTRLPVTTKAKSHPRSPLKGEKRLQLPNAVEDLESMVRVFGSSIFQERQPRSSQETSVTWTIEDHREFQHFRIVQQAACNLYDSFGTACQAHSVHNVHLSLQPDLNGPLAQVRFNVALIQNTTPGKAVWINVESTIKSCEGSFQSASSSFLTSCSSQKRPRQYEEGTCPPKVVKRVQFQQQESIPGPLQALRPEEPIVAIPNLYLQRNLCALVERSLCQGNSGSCIGLLGDNAICKHLAYIDTQTNSRTTSASSLAQLISLSRSKPTREMGIYECVRLAKYLATAVLYYHATPWLKKAWRSNDVQFFGGHDSLLQQTQRALPYITTSIQASNSIDSTHPKSFVYHHLIRNPVLFGLGIMFIELIHQAPIATLEEPIDLVKGETQDFVEYFTADRLVGHSNQIVSKSFREIIRKCLHCDFGHDSDFSSPALQEAFYHDVIAGLENLEKLFKELQLDDVKPYSIYNIA